MVAMAIRPLTDDMLTIAPRFCATIYFATAWPTRNEPFKLTLMTASQSSSVTSRNSAARKMPALLTRPSMRPNSLTVVAVAASTSAFEDTLQRMKQAAWPAARSSAASASPGGRRGPDGVGGRGDDDDRAGGAEGNGGAHGHSLESETGKWRAVAADRR